MVTAGKTKTVGQDVMVSEVMEEILKDRAYYRHSNGGLTLSGGESLCQPQFAAALLRAAKEAGLNTAIESTACAPIETIRTILPWLDYYLMDIKHISPEKHKQFTGKENTLMLENAKILAKEAKHLIIRVPVIPTFNNTKEEIADIAKFTKSILPNGEIHLLPYHRLGQDKYKGLGRTYELEHLTPPTDEEMKELLDVVLSYGLKGQIGG
jgi:pyruvate formate lyase activating enzyme